MQKNKSKAHERYFSELSPVLCKQGFSISEQEDGNLSISLNGEPVGARFHGISHPVEGTTSAPRKVQEKAWSVISDR